MAQYGMLGNLLAPVANPSRQEEIDDDNKAFRIAQLSPADTASYGSYTAGRDLGRGLGRALGGAAGVDMRTPVEKNIDAIERVKARVAEEANLDPSAPGQMDEFYKRVMNILRQEGFPNEAMTVAQEWQKQKLESSKDEMAQKEQERKSTKDERSFLLDQERIGLMRQKLGQDAPEALRLSDAVRRMRDAQSTLQPGTPQHAALEEQVNAINSRLKAIGYRHGVKLVNLGGSVDVIDDETGEVIRKDEKTEDPTKTAASKANAKKGDGQAAYEMQMQTWQNVYDTATALYNHSGTDEFVGPFSGAFTPEAGESQGLIGKLGRAAARSKNALNAESLLQQLQAEQFLAGLEQLKRSSDKGTSGLGAVTEMEGRKVQQAAAAINPQQDPADFRRQLKRYIDAVTNSVRIINESAARNGLDVVELTPHSLTGPTRGRAASAQSAPALAKSAPTTAQSAPAREEVWKRDANGKLVRSN